MKFQIYYISANRLSQEIYIIFKKNYARVPTTMVITYLRFIEIRELGLDEAIKKLWETIDSPKTEAKRE